jgi:hypothetical protein
VKWHRTTPGHIWNKLKAETNNNYVYMSNYAKTKIPEDATCDICNKTAHLKKLRVKGKRVPEWYVLDKEKMIVRCRRCKKEQSNLFKSQFAELVKRDIL